MMKTRVDLPEDLMMEIMVRLPVKSLLQFKYVSKSCYAIITNPYFIAKQVEWSNSIISKNRHSKVIFEIRPGYISMISYGEKRSVAQELKLPFLDNNPDWVFVRDTCHGILCLSGSSHLILWNPATKEVKAIPERKLRYQYSRVLGFGFDPITKDYKIVRLLGDEKHSIEVYSLSSDCWRTVYVDYNVPYGIWPNESWNSYLNGYCHWLGPLERGDAYILSFEFSKEVFGVIRLPLEVKSAKSVGVLGENLACVNFAWFGDFEIWVMNEYGVESSWTKMFKIESNLFSMHMLGLLGENEILVNQNYNRLISYNLQNQHRKRFQKRSLPLQKATSMFQYVESLVPLTTNKGKLKI